MMSYKTLFEKTDTFLLKRKKKYSYFSLKICDAIKQNESEVYKYDFFLFGICY